MTSMFVASFRYHTTVFDHRHHFERENWLKVPSNRLIGSWVGKLLPESVFFFDKIGFDKIIPIRDLQATLLKLFLISGGTAVLHSTGKTPDEVVS